MPLKSSEKPLKTKFKPYPAYKDSSVEWLGVVPEHWGVKALKYSASINSETLREDTDSNSIIEYLDISNVDSTGSILITEEMVFEDAPSRARRIVRDGDTILSTVRTYLKAVAFMDKPPENRVVSTGFAVLRPPATLDPAFLWRMVQSESFIQAVVAHSEGVGYPAISPNTLGLLPILLPPIVEQRAIATFLDRETTKIDALIEKKEQLIGLLQEKRTALITHAVTKGLDPSIPMMDSGVEWLGEIPEHWKILPLKRVASIWYGLGEPPAESADGLPFIRATNVMRGRISENDLIRVAPKEVPWNRAVVLKKNDIIVVRSGAYTGDSAIIPEEYDGAIAGYDMVVRTQSVVPKFIAWALLSKYMLQDQMILESMRAAQPHLNAEELGSIISILPPNHEQRYIAAFLDRETARFDALIGRVREATERLKELRTALISAAVTGKIDVRGEVA